MTRAHVDLLIGMIARFNSRNVSHVEYTAARAASENVGFGRIEWKRIESLWTNYVNAAMPAKIDQ